MDLLKLGRKREIGEKAKRLLENELLNQWWDNTEKTLFKRFQAAPPDDLQQLAYIKASIDALDEMKADFKRYVAEGKYAAEQQRKN